MSAQGVVLIEITSIYKQSKRTPLTIGTPLRSSSVLNNCKQKGLAVKPFASQR